MHLSTLKASSAEEQSELRVSPAFGKVPIGQCTLQHEAYTSVQLGREELHEHVISDANWGKQGCIKSVKTHCNLSQRDAYVGCAFVSNGWITTAITWLVNQRYQNLRQSKGLTPEA